MSKYLFISGKIKQLWAGLCQNIYLFQKKISLAGLCQNICLFQKKTSLGRFMSTYLFISEKKQVLAGLCHNIYLFQEKNKFGQVYVKIFIYCRKK